MCSRAAGRGLLTAVLVAGLATPARAGATPRPATGFAGVPPPPDTVACRLTLVPARVPIQDAAVLLTVRASRDPGPVRSVMVARGSGVTVLTAAPAPGSEEVVARVAMDTSDAAPGRWTMLLQGAEALCEGPLEVVRRGEPGR